MSHQHRIQSVISNRNPCVILRNTLYVSLARRFPSKVDFDDLVRISKVTRKLPEFFRELLESFWSFKICRDFRYVFRYVSIFSIFFEIFDIFFEIFDTFRDFHCFSIFSIFLLSRFSGFSRFSRFSRFVVCGKYII